MHNETLIAIAEKPPKSRTELSKISGVVGER